MTIEELVQKEMEKNRAIAENNRALIEEIFGGWDK